jgi:pimeloyl-ACP methyl ester carboxylesterase
MAIGHKCLRRDNNTSQNSGGYVRHQYAVDDSSDRSALHMTDSTSPAAATIVKKKTRWTLHGTLMLIGFGMALTYGILLAALHSSLYDSVVLIPFKATQPEYSAANGIVEAGIKAQEAQFPSADGSILHGWYFHKPGAPLTVIFHHGNAGNISHRLYIAELLLRGGNSVFLYDYRGYGKSTGVPKIAGLTPDALAAYDYLTTKLGVDPKTVVNYGESIGTGVACNVAADRPSAGLILQSSIGSLPLMGHKHFGIIKGCIPLLVLVPDFLMPSPHLDNVERIKGVHVPVIMIHGLKDTTAPVEHARMVFANAHEPKKFVELAHGTHNDVTEDSKLFGSSIETFFAQTAKSLKPNQSAKSSEPSS